MPTQRRISFSQYDTVHIYEWLVMYWSHEDELKELGGCYTCQQLEKRLRRFIGPAEAARVRRIVKRNPGK